MDKLKVMLSEALGRRETVAAVDKPEFKERVARAMRAQEALSEYKALQGKNKMVAGDLLITSVRPDADGKTAVRPTMERDFTTVRQEGQLGCPFAARASREASDGVSKPLHNLPTPRSSSSMPAQIERPPKRTSFDRASRDRVGRSPAASAAGSGPACPIRFMDQHSPEEVAKYFEEHKHELPRSHELCVKRFQDNSASIRELDAKYGNLVSMIQGLGQKHQPMLPAEGTHTDLREADKEEDRKNDKRVQSWAKAVSESAADINDTQDNADTNRANPGSDEQTRESRFERPLKEVRVGESPSRPWGVPIPSKFLDRMSDDESAASSPRQVVIQDKGEPAKPIGNIERPGAKSREQSRPKCPFDHTAMFKTAREQVDPAEERDIAAPVYDVSRGPSRTALRERETIQPDSDIAPAAADEDQDISLQQARLARAQTASQFKQGASRDTDGTLSRRIVNRGLMVVANERYLDVNGSFEVANEGTLLVGYSAENVPKILAAESLRVGRF